MPPAATSSNSQWAYRYVAAAAGGFMRKNIKIKDLGRTKRHLGAAA